MNNLYIHVGFGTLVINHSECDPQLLYHYCYIYLYLWPMKALAVVGPLLQNCKCNTQPLKLALL